MNDSVTLRQLYAINQIELFTKYKFVGSTKSEAREFISTFYDLAKYQKEKYISEKHNITEKQFHAISKIELFSEHKFKGHTKSEAREFISNFYDIAKNEMLKYECMSSKHVDF